MATRHGDEKSGHHLGIAKSLETWNRTEVEDQLKRAAVERAAVIKGFPASAWSSLSLERYALGLADNSENYSRLLEFGTPNLGSIKGGSARKHLVYKHVQHDGWYFESKYSSPEEAWEAVRAGFVSLLDHAARGEFDEIDGLEALLAAPSVRAKTAWIYFPDHLLPIYAPQHLDYWIKVFDVAVPDSVGPVGRNRRLFEAVTSLPEFEQWQPLEIMYFLYSWSRPDLSRTILKVAPGAGAELWEDCREHSYMRVGWDELGDLTQYEGLDELRDRYRELWPDKPQSQATKDARSLRWFADLEQGDVLVANRGTKTVVGIGRVTDGYSYRDELPHHRHTVDVEWFDTVERPVDFGSAWMATLVKVSPDQYHKILHPAGGEVEANGGEVPLPPVPELHKTAEQLLDRRGQVIFYGPPGTGKTYAARRHAVWLLRGGSRNPEAATSFGAEFNEFERQLSATAGGGAGTAAPTVPRLTRVTFHPTYSYEDFIEGYKPTESGRGGLELQMRSGVFKKICRAAAADPDQTFVVLIDEINRGNVPKIFGELITLIEQDKRGVSVTLPQSGEPFLVPPNVQIIATMNTADRSIHVLDAALRRRFAFLELLPDPVVLEGAMVGTLPLDEFLIALNVKIREHVGREKQIGHAMLMNGDQPIAGLQDFSLAFRYELLPLLQEYTYGDYGDLARLLGDEVIDTEAETPRREVLEEPGLLVKALVAHLELDR